MLQLLPMEDNKTVFLKSSCYRHANNAKLPSPSTATYYTSCMLAMFKTSLSRVAATDVQTVFQTCLPWVLLQVLMIQLTRYLLFCSWWNRTCSAISSIDGCKRDAPKNTELYQTSWFRRSFLRARWVRSVDQRKARLNRCHV